MSTQPVHMDDYAGKTGVVTVIKGSYCFPTGKSHKQGVADVFSRYNLVEASREGEVSWSSGVQFLPEFPEAGHGGGGASRLFW